MKLLLLVSFLVCSEGAKILAVFNFPSKSHHILGSALLKALAEKGHEVTMMSPFPLKEPVPNYEDIDLPEMLQFKQESNMMQTVMQRNVSTVTKLSQMMQMIDDLTEAFFTSKGLRDLMASKRKFDVVIVMYMGMDSYLVIPCIFGAHAIGFSTVGATHATNRITGNSAPYSYVPNIIPHFPDDMNFLERVGNTLSLILADLYTALYIAPKQEALIKKYFPNSPSANQLISNISLILLNSHYSIESPRPYVPNMIQIGGLQVQDAKELKGDLKEFMDSGKEGVILFSLGSNVKSSSLSEDKIKAIIATLSKLPLKVLWKFENAIKGLPPNVKVGKWLPQTDILGHPNTKLFITHGGLLSTTEAIYHGVPMIGMPFFGDQDNNVDTGVRKGYMVKVPIEDLTEESLTDAVTEVLINPRYRVEVQKKSAILRDQPLKPIENAVYWVEYVIRHKGAHHLKVGAVKLNWYQYYLLDVIAFLVGVLLGIIYLLYLVISVLLKFVRKMITKTDLALKIPGKRKIKAKLA